MKRGELFFLKNKIKKLIKFCLIMTCNVHVFNFDTCSRNASQLVLQVEKQGFFVL